MSTDAANAFFNAWDLGQKQFTVYSSGSTGHAKAIHLESVWMEWSAQQTAKHISISPTDHLLCCLPIDKVGGIMMLCRSRVWQLPITVVEPSSNPLLNNSKANIIAVTPHQLYHVINLPESYNRLLQFKKVLIGGSDLDASLEKAIQNLPEQCECFHTYGMSETYSHIALRRLNGRNSETYFTLFDSVSMTTNADNCATVLAPFSKTAIQTSDIVEQINEQQFRVLGRNDFVINSGSLKFHPEAIERLIMDQVAMPINICISALADEALGQKIVLVYSGIDELPEINWSKIESEIPYSQAKAIIRINEMPYNSGGKLDRLKVKAIINS